MVTVDNAKTRMTIQTAETRYGTDGGLTAAETAVVRYGNDPSVALNAPTDPNTVAVAYVNNGRWVVECPHGCGSAQYASKDDRRFWCVECGNGGSGKWATVAWPDDPAAIDNALSVRPEPQTANWLPGETIAALVAENKANGIHGAGNS